MLRPLFEWNAVTTKDELVDKIEPELATFPGIRPAFSQPIALRVNELIRCIESDIAIKIFDNDIDVLFETAERR